MQNVQPSPETLAKVAGSAVGAGHPLPVSDHVLVPLGVPLSNMTTAGLWRLQGTAGEGEDRHAFSSILKVIHTPLRWSGIEQIPEELRGFVVEHYPWRTEAEVYAGSLGQHLPEGLRLPTVHHIEELDEDSTAIWMEDVQQDPHAEWDPDRFARTAYLLGRMAGAAGAPRGNPRDLADYVFGPGEHIFIPRLRSGTFRSHPAFEGSVDDRLEEDLVALTGQLPALLSELSALPRTRAHGDACPQNLLQCRDGVVAIDWGLFGTAPAGFDLGQLLTGLVNEGLLPGSALPELAPRCLDAYLWGLRDEGATLPRELVRRGFAISTAIVSGLSALFPPELDGPDSEHLHRLIAARADMARFLIAELAASSTS